MVEPTDAEPRPTVGVDLGGSKIEVALTRANGRVITAERCSTDPSRGPGTILDDVAEAVRRVAGRAGDGAAIPVGVGVAGQVDPITQSVIRAPNLGWRDVALRDTLQERLDVPVAVLNDVQAATFGEAIHGAGQGVDDIVCVFVGTGVGGGVIAEGRLLRGCGGSAGELGHITVDLHGPSCRCGNRGCLEAFAGGWAIARRARQALATDLPESRRLRERASAVEDGITADILAAAAYDGDEIARELFAEVREALAAGVASIVNTFNPCLLLFGGGVIESVPQLVEQVGREMRSRALGSAVRNVRVEKAALGGHAGTIGAAAWVRTSVETAS